MEFLKKFFHKDAAAGSVQELRRGMWVKIKNRVGVIDRINNDGTLVVDLTNKDGTRGEIITIGPEHARQAAYLDIPEMRRPVYEFAKKLGYH